VVNLIVGVFAAIGLTAGQACAQTPGLPARQGAPAGAAQAKPAFDGGRAYEHLRQIVSFGPRPAGSPALERTRRYIIEQLAAAGITATEQAFDAQTPIGRIRMVNVIATIPGTRKERIILSGHYDTKLFNEFRFVGANDGGSSAAFLLEMARVVKARRNTFTVELVFFDGEEATVDWTGTDHTYGSRYYVQTARKAGTLSTLRALVLVDMIGDRSLRIRRENASTAWLNDLIWAAARRLGHGTVFIDESLDIGGDDHFEFLAAGVPSVDIIDFEYPAWHQPNDTLDAVSARSLEIVGAVLAEAWGQIEARLAR
jgi:Zn-dependent M28 family amino/carboxypeptidase